MIPAGSSLRISSSEDVHGRTAENTCCSRMRRAISCVYCPPKSSTTTPPSSAFILTPCSRARSAACLAALSIMPSPLAFVAAGLAGPYSVRAPPARVTPRRDSTICPARKCVSQCSYRRGAAQLPDRRASAFRLLLPRFPPVPSPCPAGVHSPARESRPLHLSPVQSALRSSPAISRSIARHRDPTFPITPLRDELSSGPKAV